MCAGRGLGIGIKGRSFLRCVGAARPSVQGRRRADQEEMVAAVGKDIIRDWRRWSRLERWIGVAILMLAVLSVPAAVLFERDAGVPIATEAIAGPTNAN